MKTLKPKLENAGVYAVFSAISPIIYSTTQHFHTFSMLLSGQHTASVGNYSTAINISNLGTSPWTGLFIKNMLGVGCGYNMGYLLINQHRYGRHWKIFGTPAMKIDDCSRKPMDFHMVFGTAIRFSWRLIFCTIIQLLFLVWLGFLYNTSFQHPAILGKFWTFSLLLVWFSWSLVFSPIFVG